MNSWAAAIFVMFVFAWPAAAQSDTSRTRPSWFMTMNGGALFAKKVTDSAPSIYMRQGMRYHRFALSVGVGYDAYKDWRTFPLFTGASYDFLQGSDNALYFQLDAGYSRALHRARDEAQREYRNAGGYFYHPAIGYRAGKGRVQIHISVGYRIQITEYDANPVWWGGWYNQWGGWYGQRVTVTQHMERLSFLIGLGLR